MTRRAACSPDFRMQRLLAISALSAATILLGCGGGGGGNGGGGGGGGGGTLACGSPSTSTTVVVCGRVVVDGSGSAAAGVVISVRNAAGTVLTNGAGAPITATTDGNGNFLISGVPGAGVQYSADPPAAAFTTGFAKVNGAVFTYILNNQAGTSKCFPALKGGAALPAGDTKIADTFVFSNAVPPPPAFGCPR